MAEEAKNKSKYKIKEEGSKIYKVKTICDDVYNLLPENHKKWFDLNQNKYSYNNMINAARIEFPYDHHIIIERLKADNNIIFNYYAEDLSSCLHINSNLINGQGFPIIPLQASVHPILSFTSPDDQSYLVTLNRQWYKFNEIEEFIEFVLNNHQLYGMLVNINEEDEDDEDDEEYDPIHEIDHLNF